MSFLKATYMTNEDDGNENTMPQVEGHSGEYSNAAKLAGKMSKSVMQLISIHF